MSPGSGSPLFSVVIPTFGRPAFLAEAVNSVLAQTVDDFECIVVDDASPEPVTLPVDDPRVRVIRHDTNRGVTVARNTGLNFATGRYVAFLDDDDLFTPRRLEVALTGLARAPVALCAAAAVHDPTPLVHHLEGNVHDRIVDTTTPHLGCVAVRAEACARFDERFPASQDVDWWLRMTARHPVTSEPEVGWLWRRHDGPRSGNGTRARLECGLRLLEVHHDYFAAHPKAASFRWFRISALAAALGDTSLTRRAALRSVRLHPRPKTAARAARLLWQTRRPATPSAA